MTARRKPGRPTVWKDNDMPRHNFIIRCTYEQYQKLKKLLPKNLYERYELINFLCESLNKDAKKNTVREIPCTIEVNKEHEEIDISDG